MPETESEKRQVRISKALSYLLRHGAIKENLPIDSNGYIPIEKLLAHQRLKSHKATVQDIYTIVETSDKQRFQIRELPDTAEKLICATQGHSIAKVVPSQEVLDPVRTLDQLPLKLIHGTNLKNCILILKSGLIKKMGRNHVHLSPGITGKDVQVISGMRYSSNVFIHIKRSEETLKRLNLFKSLNNVYLSETDIPIALVDYIEIRSSKKSRDEPYVSEVNNLAKIYNISVTYI